MNIDDVSIAHVDEVLSTTRAVRRRLDLERPVDNQLLLDCIDLAEQAPTGGNISSRRWIIVRDEAVKDQLGDMYRQAALPFMSRAAERLRGSGHPQEQVMSSAAYLAEHLADVPAIVIPTIIGRYDGSGRPGLFDSVIQAAWSFCLALRARGLGSTWVTAALEDQAGVKEILGIPSHMTEVVLLPVAWTKGTEFRRAPRQPARAITYFDHWGTTFESGPGESLSLQDGPGVIAEIDIDASPSVVWEFVTNIESVAAEWAHVDTYDEHRAFGWRTSGTEHPGARWLFELHPTAGQTRLRFVYRIGPENHPGKEARLLRRQLDEVYANMQRAVEGIKQLAEARRPR
jgi:nitroreductase